ncbi:MMPL family transporter [Vibrio sp.]|nr:MMPL family transporter [Vibrio sp.]
MNQTKKGVIYQSDQLLRALIRAPKFAIAVLLMIIIVSSIGITDLKFRGDYNIFFDSGNPQLLSFQKIQAEFAKSDSLAIIVAPKNKDVFTQENLSLIRSLTEDAWMTPYSSRVDSLTNYQHTEADGDSILVSDLVPEDFAFSDNAISHIKDVATHAVEIKDSIVPPDGKVSLINITVQLPEKNKTSEIIEVHNYITDLIKKYEKNHPDVHFYQSGVVALNYALMSSAEHDIKTLVPTMLLVIVLFLAVLLRSLLSVLATLIVIAVSVSVTLGLSGWLGISLNVATVNIPTLILTLSVADCVHIIATMRHKMAEGLTKNEAIFQSLKLDVIPVIITSVTTAIGFFMMNMSDSPVLRTFGNLASLGVIIACSFSLILLPVLLSILPISVKKSDANEHLNSMDKLATFIISKRKFIFPISIICICVSAFLIPQNQINDDSVKYFNKGSEFRQAADFMQQNLSGMGSISVVIDTGSDNGIVRPEFLTTVDAFTSWLRAQSSVDHVASISDIFKRLNMNMHDDDKSYKKLPDSRELSAQYLLMYEMSLPFGLDLNNQINIDKSAIKIQVTTDNLGSRSFIKLENSIHQWFRDHTKDGQYMITTSSPSLMFAHIGNTNMKSMLFSLPLSLLMISALLILALRSFKLGIISIFPNMVPAIIGFGLWAIISGEINLALSVVASLTLGIVVDDCVHFLAKYKIARQSGANSEESVRYAFHNVGRALWVTSVVLVAGFMVLSLSDFRLNSDMGLLSSIIIFLALIIDFFFLPCLLMILDRDKKQVIKQADV